MAGNLLARTLSRKSFTDALAGDAFIRAMLAFEAALAQSEADAGVIPREAANVIEAACSGASLSADKLAADGRLAGSLAIPVVRALTEQVRAMDAKAASFVHFGSTSQDVLDTASVICMLPCVVESDRVLANAVKLLAAHARDNAGTVMLGRTMLQPAIPITAGIKIARWATALNRCRLRLAESSSRALCVQLGGPVGTLDALGARRVQVRRGVAERLGLGDARSWHTHRDELLSFASSLAILVATVGKIAGDIALLSQAEVGEMLEAVPKKGVGTSSAMPHKRNPVACLQALAAAARAPGLFATMLHAGHEHERAIGGWQAELATLPELLETAGAALDAVERISAGLVVDPVRMRRNIDALDGLVFSERLARLLMGSTDRASAQSQVDDWCTAAVVGKRHLRDVVAESRSDLDLAVVFSTEALVRELAPVLEEELGAL